MHSVEAISEKTSTAIITQLITIKLTRRTTMLFNKNDSCIDK